jgi:hypothetical protein
VRFRKNYAKGTRKIEKEKQPPGKAQEVRGKKAAGIGYYETAIGPAVVR